MAENLQEYLNRLQSDQIQQQRASTLEWYLEKIKELTQSYFAQKGEEEDRKVEENAQGQEQEVKSDSPEEEVKDYVSDTSVVFNPNLIGRMLFFSYDPKWKNKLPYYDTFPLVFLLSVNQGSSLGFNMHYLPPYERAMLMQALMTLANTTIPNVNTKLLMTYKLLKESSKYVYFKPCIKRYLHGHIRSRLLTIHPEKWQKTLFLPLANFVKAPEARVWQDSIDKIAATTKRYKH